MAAAPEHGRATQVEPVAAHAGSLAVADLFEEYSRRIYAHCLKRLRSREEAEDAVQATYLNACRHLMRGFEPEAAQAWLMKVADNECTSRLRSSSRRARAESGHDVETIEETIAAPDRAPDELFGIEDALVTLPEQQRRAILLREWQGLSYREVAAELGLSQSAVEALIFRARRSLAEALETLNVRETAPKRRRFFHAFDVSAMVAGLKASLAANVATSVAVAVSAATIVTGPLDRPVVPPTEERQPDAEVVPPTSPGGRVDRLSSSAASSHRDGNPGKGKARGHYKAKGKGHGKAKSGPPAHAKAKGHGGGHSGGKSGK